MTYPTDEELDKLVKLLRNHWLCLHDEARVADAITALRNHLAEANARADLAEAALNEAKEETKDANSVLEAWFDRRELGHKAVDQAVLDAASGYLRTSRSGGMSQKKSDLVLAVFQDMARLGAFADLFARAAKTQNEAALAAQIEVDAWLADRKGWPGTMSEERYAGLSERDEAKMDCADAVAQAIRNQPHDRTALDRMLADAREKALMDAARMFNDDSNISQTILALIKPEEK